MIAYVLFRHVHGNSLRPVRFSEFASVAERTLYPVVHRSHSFFVEEAPGTARVVFLAVLDCVGDLVRHAHFHVRITRQHCFCSCQRLQRLEHYVALQVVSSQFATGFLLEHNVGAHNQQQFIDDLFFAFVPKMTRMYREAPVFFTVSRTSHLSE